MEENPETPIVLVGAKKDLVDSKILDHYLLQFEEKRAEFPNSEKFLDHLFVSSKTFEGIEEVFVKIHEALIY